MTPTNYDKDLAFAIENTAFDRDYLSYILQYPRWENLSVVVETPNGPLAITHVEEQDGVLKLFTLE